MFTVEEGVSVGVEEEGTGRRSRLSRVRRRTSLIWVQEGVVSGGTFGLFFRVPLCSFVGKIRSD